MPFRKVGEESTYDGPFVHVVRATFEGDDGHRFERELIRHRDAVAVVVVDGGDVVLVRQYRPALEVDLLEIPAGMRDVDGESALDTARRELEEEAGRRPVGDLELLVEYDVAAGLTDEVMTIYLCRASEPCPARPQSVEEAEMEIVTVALDDVPAMIADGRIRDAKTIIGLLVARDRL